MSCNAGSRPASNPARPTRNLYSEVESTLLKHLMQHFDQKPTVLARVLKMNRATLLKKRRHLGLESEKVE